MEILQPISSPQETILSRALKPVRRLYDWTVSKAAHPHAERYLFGLAFAESSFFPIPPDVLLIALSFAERKRAFRYALVCGAGSVLGGAAGYLIGYALYQSIGVRIVEFYHLQSLIETIGLRYQEAAFWTVFTAAFTPIPYKLITIAAGVFKIAFWPFMVASLIGRSLRFFLVAGVIYWVGPKAKPFIEKYFEWFTLGFTVLLLGGFIALKYL